MASSSEISTAFLRLAKASTDLHGRWLPVVYWTDRLVYRVGNIKVTKLKTTLERQGLVGRQLGDHDDIYIEFLSRNVIIDNKELKRLFICISSPMHPEIGSDRNSSQAFRAILQQTWNEFKDPMTRRTTATTPTMPHDPTPMAQQQEAMPVMMQR